LISVNDPSITEPCLFMGRVDALLTPLESGCEARTSLGEAMMNQVLVKLCRSATLVLVAMTFLGNRASADSRPSDQKMERFLLKANVTRIHMVVAATTNPMAVDLERKGEIHRAAFKYGQGDRPDPGNTEYHGANQPSLDSYMPKREDSWSPRGVD
jgi:hypothetical protein